MGTFLAYGQRSPEGPFCLRLNVVFSFNALDITLLEVMPFYVRISVLEGFLQFLITITSVQKYGIASVRILRYLFRHFCSHVYNFNKYIFVFMPGHLPNILPSF